MVTKNFHVVIGFTQRLFCDGLECMIEASEDFSMRESIQLENLEDFLKNQNSIDIVIIELNYPNQDSLNFLTQIKEGYPHIHVLLISKMPAPKLGSKLMESGIDAYLLKTCSKQDLFAALNKIMTDKSFFCSDIIKAIMFENGNNNKKILPEINLSQRESEILSLLVNSKTNIDIAKELGISENTVKTHRKNLYAKFGANNMFGMIRYACRKKLIDFYPEGFCCGCPRYINIFLILFFMSFSV